MSHCAPGRQNQTKPNQKHNQVRRPRVFQKAIPALAQPVCSLLSPMCPVPAAPALGVCCRVTPGITVDTVEHRVPGNPPALPPGTAPLISSSHDLQWLTRHKRLARPLRASVTTVCIRNVLSQYSYTVVILSKYLTKYRWH